MKCSRCGRDKVQNCNEAGQTAKFSSTRDNYGLEPYVYGRCQNASNGNPIFAGPYWNRQIIGYEPNETRST